MEVVCSILDIDLIETCLILSRNPNVLSQPTSTAATDAKERKSKRKSKSAAILEEAGLSPGASVVGLVEHKTPYFLVLSCSTLTGCKLAYGLINSVSLQALRQRHNAVQKTCVFLSFQLTSAYKLLLFMCCVFQGQLGVLPSAYHHLRVGQQVTGSVMRYASGYVHNP